jgi:Txe/YoeB family toxin of Txe-Axe toxin-antitoxin module
MTNFHVKLDDKFDELIGKMKEKKFGLGDLVELKSYIYDVYSRESSIEDKRINRGFRVIDYRI